MDGIDVVGRLSWISWAGAVKRGGTVELLFNAITTSVNLQNRYL